MILGEEVPTVSPYRRTHRARRIALSDDASGLFELALPGR